MTQAGATGPVSATGPAGPAAPIQMEPGKEYLGLQCVNCLQLFPIAGPLTTPPNETIRVGHKGPLVVRCPHCQREATYTMEQLRRTRSPLP